MILYHFTFRLWKTTQVIYTKYYKSAIISIALNNQFGNFYVLSSWSLCSYMGLPLSDGTMMLPLTLKCQKTKNCFHTMLKMSVSYMHILCHVCTVVWL